MKIFKKSGICIEDKEKKVILDPTRIVKNSVVSHAHLDHLRKGAVMTPQTLDIMGVRKGSRDGIALKYDEEKDIGGFKVLLKDAGHVLGSAMISVEDVLYTGDFNPEGGLTCGKAEPHPCETLIIESTYGKPKFCLPPKSESVESFLCWAEVVTKDNPMAVGAYEFGKAQEIIGLVNQTGIPVFTTDKIAEISDVYKKHNIPLDYKKISELTPEESKNPYVLVLPNRMLKTKEMKAFRRRGGKTCFVSGWCAFYPFKNDLDARFPISDHGDFNDLLWFTEMCKPKKVYTCHGHSKELAKEIESRLGIKANSLDL